MPKLLGEASSLEALKGINSIGLCEAAIYHFTSDIQSVLEYIDDEKSLRFSARILLHRADVLVLRLMPKNVHATAVAGFTYALHAAGDRAFGAFWMDNVFLKGGRVQLGNDGERNVKQADGCWGPCAGHRAPTVVLEVGAAQTLAALRGDVGRWFVPGAATNLAILLSTTKRAGAGPACVVEMYTPVRAAAPKLIYRGAWHADASEPPPCAVPLAAFFAADAQLQVPAGAEVNIPPEAMRTVYRAVCGAVQEEEEEERQREMV